MLLTFTRFYTYVTYSYSSIIFFYIQASASQQTSNVTFSYIPPPERTLQPRWGLALNPNLRPVAFNPPLPS